MHLCWLRTYEADDSMPTYVHLGQQPRSINIYTKSQHCFYLAQAGELRSGRTPNPFIFTSANIEVSDYFRMQSDTSLGTNSIGLNGALLSIYTFRIVLLITALSTAQSILQSSYDWLYQSLLLFSNRLWRDWGVI